jgi:threonine dehydratase
MNARPAPRPENDAAPSDPDLLRRMLAARVYEVARETPLEDAVLLSARLGNRVLLKREDLQPVFSFKLRGAYNRMAALSAAERANGVVAASAGNHAQGVALAAAKLGVRAVVVMPVTAPQVKVDAVRRFGGEFVEVLLAGDSYNDAQAAAARIEAERGLVRVHPFDDLEVIAGQATVGLELLRQSTTPLDAVFVPVGGGGLLAGVASCIKALSPRTRVIGVQADDSDAMARSLEAGMRVTLPEVGLFADGTAVKQVGALTFELCRRHVDEMLRVDGDALCAAIRDVYQETRNVPEPSGALALAGLKQYAATRQLHGATLAAIVSGANMNFERLRFVAERAEAGEQREALFAVTIPEERGSFRRFCAVMGQRSVTEFNYRIADARTARIFVSVQIARRGEGADIMRGLQEQGFAVSDLTHNEVSKQHIRYMVGGRSPLAGGERLFRFEFPERPGALMKFLTAMAPNWNISLFHYRNQGADFSSVLVGIQAPVADDAALDRFLAQLGYAHSEETANEAYRQFLI